MTTPIADENGVNPFHEFLFLYGRNCTRMVREVFGVDPDEWQAEVMDSYSAGERRISIRSGHGVGKTTVLAWIMCHHIVCRFPQKTVCTAPTSAQLFDALWSEFRAWIGKLPQHLQDLLEVKSDRVELRAAPAESFTSAKTSRAETPEAMAGVHSENVLIIPDEASGIPEPVFVAGSGSMSGEHACTILAGNPVRLSGLFYDTHNRPEVMARWKRFHISCEDSPRVTKDFIADCEAKWGRDSNEFRVRVLGEFPLTDLDTIIPFDLVEAARVREVRASLVMSPKWGVDCARFGDDRSALAKRRGNALMEPVQWRRGLDTMQVAGWIKSEWDHTPPSERPSEINVDAIGLGAGVVDRLRQLGLPARGINVSESPALGERYRNLKAELWFKGLEWFKMRDCVLPNDTRSRAGIDELVRELTAVKYKYTLNGKIQIEAKDELKKRLRMSPDLADAFILTFAGAAISAQQGSFGSTRWNQPLPVRKGIV